MKISASNILVALMAIVIAILSWALIYTSRDELRIHDEEVEEEIETQSSATVENGRAIVSVDEQSQVASGIQVTPLLAARNESTVVVYGSVMDITPLLDLRSRYLRASGERRAMHAAAEAARAEYQRAQTLYRDDRNISEHAMRSAESRFQVAQARLTAADAARSALRDSLLSSWGAVVGGWAIAPDSDSLQKMFDRRSALVQLVFPYALPRSAAQTRVLLAPVSSVGQQIEAKFVSESPQISSVVPGNTYFYLVEGAKLRAATRVVARVAENDALGETARDGIVVPNAAVVWHVGKAWVYVKQDADRFARYEISTTDEVAGGWFQKDRLQAGAQVVVSGAQLLLSEELKFQIRNENED